MYFVFIPKVTIRQKKTETLLEFRERLWYALSSNVGYLRKGGSFDFYEATDPGLNMLKRNMKYMFEYGNRE